MRRGNPPELFERFIRSYRRHAAGTEHRLVIVCKGFSAPDELIPLRERLDGLESDVLEVSDQGFDVSAYQAAASRVDGEWLCFLNSHSELLVDGWLEALRVALRPQVGIAGATGSWGSSCSLVRYHLRLPSVYGAIFPDHQEMHAVNAEVERGVSAGTEHGESAARRWGREVAQMLYTQVAFAPFPSYHVRTNAFAIRSELMRTLSIPRLRVKAQSWRLESGRGSITGQLAGRGLRACVVGRNGLVYEQTDWHHSETFWQGDQANLLVADNQTEKYRRADLRGRGLLAGIAWGPFAQPLGAPARAVPDGEGDARRSWA